jgi:hypothetical protein
VSVHDLFQLHVDPNPEPAAEVTANLSLT